MGRKTDETGPGGPARKASASQASEKEAGRKRTVPPLADVRREASRLRRQVEKLRQALKANEGSAYDLGERVKELNCLYSISSIVQRQGITLGEILQETVGIIPDAWQYPEITCCRIILGNETFRTSNFRKTRWGQSCPVVACGGVMGSVEVFYLRKKPERDEGPFLKEERSLINGIGEQIGAIVEWKESEKALKESEAKNRALLNAIPDIIFQLDREGTFLGFHEGTFSDLTEFFMGLVGKNIYCLSDEMNVIPRRMLEHCMVYMDRAFSTGKTQLFEQHIHLGRKGSDFEVRIVVSREDEVLCMVRDITLRKRLEREILEISGREQRRIGRDLHDSLCQHLAGIGFLTKALEMQISAGGQVKPEGAAEIVGLIDQAITLTRGFARGLNPVRLEADGLMNGLLELAANTERLFGIKCHVEFFEPVLLRDNGAALHLYRIVQEALSNAIKHGKAKKVFIRFRKEGSQNILSVKDDGVGFAETPQYGGGIGINIMSYRASMIGASLDIGNDPEGGVLLVCSFQDRNDAKEEG